MRPRHSTSLLLGAMLLVLPAGCASDTATGYTAASMFPAEVRTVHVPVLRNDTFNRNVQFELTDALIKEIEARTPYKVTRYGKADSIFLGTVRQVELDSLSRSRLTGLTEEGIVSVTIDFEWRDLRTGRTLLSRQAFTGHGLFVPSRPAGEPIELGEFAAVEQLARDIVAEMRAPW